MWNLTKALLDSFEIFHNIFSEKTEFICLKCRQHYCFIVFRVAFSTMPTQYILKMLFINIIDYKVKDSIVIFFFAFVIFNKTSAIKNISVFKNLVIWQMSFTKKIFY